VAPFRGEEESGSGGSTAAIGLHTTVPRKTAGQPCSLVTRHVSQLGVDWEGVDTLWLKLILTPLLIGSASLAGRRYGAAVGGWLVGLPLTSGPIALFLALERGTGFASDAAEGILVGLISVATFCLAYGLLAPLPIFVGVLAVFAHFQQGSAAAVGSVSSAVVGSFAFTAFFLVVAGTVEHIGIIVAFAGAALAALSVQGA
jgi:hypothetical protein